MQIDIRSDPRQAIFEGPLGLALRFWTGIVTCTASNPVLQAREGDIDKTNRLDEMELYGRLLNGRTRGIG